MAEGDTIHRTARRLRATLGDHLIESATATDPRSPARARAGELEGRTLETVEARGKNLLLFFSEGLAVHSHLGINGGWTVRPGGPPPRRRAWLLLSSQRAVAAQFGGKVLRVVSASRLRADPRLRQLGPDPLGPGFDTESAARRLLGLEPEREVGDALLDQRVIAGIGNAIRAEALFRARVSPWRRIGRLDDGEALALVSHTEGVMRSALASGRRPRSIYRTAGRPCPRCGTLIRSRGQGDANRIAYWCPRCQA